MVIPIALLALAIPTTASAVGSPRWVNYPTCTATTSALTCSGKAAGVQPQSIFGVGRVQAGIFGHVHWLCTDPVFDFIGSGNILLQDLLSQPVDIHNGQAFTIHFTPSSYDFDFAHLQGCTGGYILDPSDPSYCDVSVAVGWGIGSPGGPNRIGSADRHGFSRERILTPSSGRSPRRPPRSRTPRTAPRPR